MGIEIEETGEDSLLGLVSDALDPESYKHALRQRRERRVKFLELAGSVLQEYPQPIPTEISRPHLEALSKPVVVHVNGKEIPVHVVRYVEVFGEDGVDTTTGLVILNNVKKNLIHIFGVRKHVPLQPDRFNTRSTRVYKGQTQASNIDMERGLSSLMFIQDELSSQ